MGLATVAGALPWSTGRDGRERSRERTAVTTWPGEWTPGGPTERLAAPFLEVCFVFRSPVSPDASASSAAGRFSLGADRTNTSTPNHRGSKWSYTKKVFPNQLHIFYAMSII